MDKDLKLTSPRYQQIAADVAAKIAEHYYKEGEKIYARSSLASQYGVSAETARRAICILTDMKIVETTKGSGVLIKSRDNAVKFVNQFKNIQMVGDLKKEILGQIEKQNEQQQQLKHKVLELMDKTERFKMVNPFMPFEIIITETSRHIGESLSASQFWHNTAATVIAIKRGEVCILSPGPYAVMLAGDVLYYVGDENSHERVKNFLFGSD